MNINGILKRKNIYNVIPLTSQKDMYVTELSYRRRQPAVSKTTMKKSYFAFHLFLSGSGTLVAPEKTYTIRKNDVFVRFPGEPLAYYDDPADPWSYIFITFMGTQVASILRRLNITPENRVFSGSDKLTALFVNAVVDCKKNQAFKDLIANACLTSAFAALAAGRTPEAEKSGAAPSGYIEDALNYIEEHYSSSDLDAAEVANYLGLNVDYFLRLFKATLKTNFSHYLITKRLNIAISMIEDNPRMPVNRVADSVGYATPAYFTYSFRKTYGVSPFQYRKQRSGMTNGQ